MISLQFESNKIECFGVHPEGAFIADDSLGRGMPDQEMALFLRHTEFVPKCSMAIFLGGSNERECRPIAGEKSINMASEGSISDRASGHKIVNFPLLKPSVPGLGEELLIPHKSHFEFNAIHTF